MESVSPVTVLAHDLGPLGCLLELSPSSDAPGVVSRKATPIVIIDRSGSMDAYCEHAITTCVPSALLQCGYSNDDEVIIISFDSVSERVFHNGVNPTIGVLASGLVRVTCRGSTNMSGVIPLFVDLLGQSDAYHVIVISDGAISDQRQTSNLAVGAVANLTPNQAMSRISATLIRFMTSPHAAPDTSALTCIGNFCNTGQETKLIDVFTDNSQGKVEVGVVNLTTAVADGCKSAGCGKSIRLASVGGECIFKQTPSSEECAVTQIPCGVSTLMLLSGPVPASVLVGDCEYPVVNLGMPKTVHSLDRFVELVGSQLKMSMLAANGQISSEVQARIDQTLRFFDEAQKLIESVHSTALEEVDLTVAGRARAIAKAVKASTATAIDRLRQQMNKNRVATLNAQQKADWLRGVSDNKSGRALARRVGDSADFEADSRSAILSLARALHAQPSQDDDSESVSFYSQASALECLEGAKELESVVESIGLSEWQQCIGGLGVPVRHTVGDYVDPWCARVREVYCGTILSECDVFMSAVQSGSGATNSLKCPGRPDGSNEITAVIPLLHVDPVAFKLYLKNGRALAECQASAQLRRAVTCLPYDMVALSTAGLWNLAGIAGSNVKQGVLGGGSIGGNVELMTCVERRTIKGFRENLEYLIGTSYKPDNFQSLFEDMKRPDPRPWLSGVSDVSNVLKPITSIVRFGFPGTAAMRALYHLETYQAASRTFRGSDDPVLARRKTLHEVLGIDFEKNGTRLKPLFEDEGEPKQYDVVVLSDIGQRLSHVVKWIPWVAPYVGVHSLVTGAESSDVLTFGCSVDVLIATAAIQAIVCSSESDRIDTKALVSLVPDLVKEEDAVTYIAGVQRKIYFDEYKKRLAAKMAEEDRILTERVVKELVDTSSFEDFSRILASSRIVNRDHQGFNLLLSQISQTDGSESKQFKLGLLITGRDIRVGSDASLPVWAKGNVWNRWRDYVSDQKFFSEALEQRISDIFSRFGIHQYRDAASNRHKHGNGFLSYFAMGYKDLAEMKRAVSAEEFSAYVNAHCIKNRCCLPNVGERKGFGIN